MKAIVALAILLLLVTPWERAARLVAAGDLEGAEREYRLLVQQQPGDPEAAYNLGTVLLLQGRWDDARPFLVRATEGSRQPAPYFNLGNTDLEPASADSLLAQREQRLHRAIQQFKQALLLDPRDEDARWNLELARRLLEREAPPPGGGGGGGGADGAPAPGAMDPSPAPASGRGGEPDALPSETEALLRAAQERELQVQRNRLTKPQPPGPVRP
jgi:tetratricopeptide (TPR) repeat protein